MTDNISYTPVHHVSTRSIGVVGSRSLPFNYTSLVGDIVQDLLSRGYHITSGGAVGTDQYVIEQLLHSGECQKGTIYAAWRNYKGFPIKVRAMHRQFRSYKGSIVWGLSSGKEPAYMIKNALLSRNVSLVEACYGMVFFLTAGSRGSIFTLKKAIAEKMPIVVFPVECELPSIPNIKWRAIKCGGAYENAFKVVYVR